MDPFTNEIIRNGFLTIADEMCLVMRRTSKSPIIYEVLDFGVGLTDTKGNLLAMGYGVPFLLATLENLVRAVIAKRGASGIAPGDVYISNDPYRGAGSHLNDMGLVMPVHDEGTLVAFVAVNAHWTDVGGKDPGSMTTDSREIFQEGFQLPIVKLFDRGEPVQDMFDLIEQNVRLPEMSMGDLWASIAALRVAERRMKELLARYGRAAVKYAMADLLDYGETMVRAELKRLPKGTFAAEDWIDQDGLGNGPFPIRVAVTITDDDLTMDFTGSAPQLLGPINCSPLALDSAARCAFHAITTPSLAVNSGCFRPLKVVCPDGTVFSAVRPAPLATYYEGMAHAVELVWKALALHIPRRLTAGHHLSTCVTILAGVHPETEKFYVMVETLTGGWGAGFDKDGVNGTGCVANGETYNIPIEVRETKFGVRVNSYRLHDEDGGAGEFRGGKGVEFEYELTSPAASLTAIFGRHLTRPWGLSGGEDGTTNYVEVIRTDGHREIYGRVARVPLAQGDRVRFVTGTGGGFGDPKKRPREKLIGDVRDGYVTASQANAHYGVVLPAAAE